jgi:hypothetical protein
LGLILILTKREVENEPTVINWFPRVKWMLGNEIGILTGWVWCWETSPTPSVLVLIFWFIYVVLGIGLCVRLLSGLVGYCCLFLPDMLVLVLLFQPYARGDSALVVNFSVFFDLSQKLPTFCCSSIFKCCLTYCSVLTTSRWLSFCCYH